jgi:Kinesin motor domain
MKSSYNLAAQLFINIYIAPTSFLIGTGKTHTMEGDFNSEEFAGIVPRSVNAILDALEGSDADYSVRVSFLELCKLLCDFILSRYSISSEFKT